MKKEDSKIPKGAPEDTVWFGGPIGWFKISVKITSLDLDPKVITEIFGCEPDKCWQKDNPILREDGSVKRIPKFGYWSIFINPKNTEEVDCCEAAMELLKRLPQNINKWLLLSKQYDVEIMFALSFESSNKGFVLSNEFLKYIGERGISAGFDIYHDNSTT
jgi:hypothetical protein